MIEAKIDITINISELASDSQYDPADKAESKTERVYPKGEMNLALQSLSAKLLKDMCKDRGYCTGCLFHDEGCKIQTRPELWRI